tara:strand:+ start:3802 stop:4635 length:834 start_codon:yes stop_codon:yes gene_type:complete
MRILIRDYTKNNCSQSMLLHTAINKYTDIEALFWQNNSAVSTYDLLDDVRPDYILISAMSITDDLVHYLNENSSSPKIILHIPNDMPYAGVRQIHDSEFFRDHVCLAISSHDIITRVRSVNLKPCADINIMDYPYPNKIPLGIVTVRQNADKKLKIANSFHIMSYEKCEEADIPASSLQLGQLYANYDKIIFDGITKFDQPFFDALYKTDEVFYSSNESLSEECIKLFGQDLNINNKDIDFNIVKATLREKHLPMNRMKQLLSQLGIDQSLFTEVSK